MRQDFIAATHAHARLLLSDIHLFNTLNGALQYHGAMIEYLKPDTLDLLGDIIDNEFIASCTTKYLEKKRRSLTEPPQTFKEILNEVLGERNVEKSLRFWDLLEHQKSEGMTCNYFTGNHDNNLEIYAGQTINGINYYIDKIVNFDGVPTLMEHGHRNDKYCNGNFNLNWFIKQCCRTIDNSVLLDYKRNQFKNIILKAFGQEDIDPTYHVTNMVKKFGKSFITDIYEEARDRAIDKGAHQVIMGHTHIAGIFDVSEKTTKIPLDANHGMHTIQKEKTFKPFICRNGGDGFTNGSGQIYTPETGFKMIDKTMIPPSETFDLSKENPYQKYREKTLKTLEKQYEETFLPIVNLEQEWDHSGTWNENHKKQENMLEPYQIPSHNNIFAYTN